MNNEGWCKWATVNFDALATDVSTRMGTCMSVRTGVTVAYFDTPFTVPGRTDVIQIQFPNETCTTPPDVLSFAVAGKWRELSEEALRDGMYGFIERSDLVHIDDGKVTVMLPKQVVTDYIAKIRAFINQPACLMRFEGARMVFTPMTAKLIPIPSATHVRLSVTLGITGTVIPRTRFASSRRHFAVPVV